MGENLSYYSLQLDLLADTSKTVNCVSFSHKIKNMKASWLRRQISWLSYKARFGGIEGKCGGWIGGKCGGGIGGKGRGLVLLFACILASVIRNYNFTEGENTVSGVWRNDGKLRY